MLHINIKAEPVFRIFDFGVTNSLLLSSIVMILFIIVALEYRRSSHLASKNKFFYFLTLTLKAIYSLFESVFGEKTNYFFPLVGSFFFFILLQNWFGLLPGVGSLLIKTKVGHETALTPLFRGNTTDLNTTISLALISVVFSQYVGIKQLGFKEYIKKFINFGNPMMFFTGIMETISEFSKIVSFSFRLFGNIFAGEVIISIVAFLIPVLVSFPFFLFEIFVGLIQAIVFSMLSAVFFNLAMQKTH